VPVETAARELASPQLNASAGGGREPQTVRRLRPFARRRAKTRRPERVAMRARKPCVRWRRILLGW
jgi:hypothetical protein